MQKSIRLQTALIFTLIIFAGSLPVTAGQPSPGGLTSHGKDAAYWFDKGALCSTYGNNRAAVRYFQKAIDLDPQNSRALFSQGVSYGQMGDFDQAIARIDRALALAPQNGLYYYGRGRVYLLAGREEKAMADFRKAADLGDEDAINFLQEDEMSRQ